MIRKSFHITLSLAAITKAVSVRTMSTQATGDSLSESMLMQVSTDVTVQEECVDIGDPQSCAELNATIVNIDPPRKDWLDYYCGGRPWYVSMPESPARLAGPDGEWQIDYTMCCGCR